MRRPRLLISFRENCFTALLDRNINPTSLRLIQSGEKPVTESTFERMKTSAGVFMRH